jgi:two-component system, cell cycle sensor histidine kinase and response regulator CckA
MTNSMSDIKSRIRVVIGITLAAVIAISAIGIVSGRRDSLAKGEKIAAAYSRALADHSESTFSEGDAMLRELLRELRREGGLERVNPREIFELMQVQLRESSQAGMLFIADRKGEMRINSETFPPKEVNVADREYFRRYLQSPGLGLAFSDPLISRVVKRPRFNLMRPLNRPAEPFAGLIALGFEADYFTRFFSPANLGFGGLLTLVRDDGTPLVYDPVPKGGEPGKSPLFKDQLPRSGAGVFTMKNSFLRGEPLIVGYRHLDRFPIMAVVALNEDDVLQSWRARAMRQGILTLCLSVLIILLTRVVCKHLEKLEKAQTVVSGQQAQLAIKAAQIDAATDMILQIDEQGRLVSFNRALSQTTGYSMAELRGSRLHDIEPPEFAARIEENLATLRAEGYATFESAFLSRAGESIPLEVHARIMGGEGRQVILAIARDIRERKKDELRERNRLKILERIATDAPIEELLVSIVHFVEQESPGALGAVLLADEGGVTLRHGAAPSLPEAYNKAVDGVLIAPGHGSCGSAAYLRRRVEVEDIETHPSWRGFQPARDAGLRSCWSEPLLSSNGTLLGTLAIYHREPRLPDEKEILLLESAAHLAGIAIGRVRDEESRRGLEEQLRHSQKLEAVGRLAAGIAHDFNNLLTPVIVYSELLRRGMEPGGSQQKMLDAVSQAAQKASELTQKLLSFGRKQVLSRSLLDLNEVIASFGDIMRSTVKESINIEKRLSPGAAQVHADRGQLEQVLLNLLVNAQDAIPGTGMIAIETGHLVLDQGYAKQHPGIVPGSYVQLAITDNGCGMSEETLSRIYEPFFTTKEAGHGTGLGLATVYGIVKNHGGQINVVSRPGEGTRFEIFLPEAAGGSKPVQGKESTGSQPHGKGRTILLVEDDQLIREMAVDLLVSFGYRVLAADSPSRAIELAEGGECLDLLATDVVMPELSGPELHGRLLDRYPQLPVLYISGYSNTAACPAKGLADGTSLLLAKPFTVEQFLQRIADLLDGRGCAATGAEQEAP